MNELEQKLATARKKFHARLIFGGLGGILLFAVILPLAYFTHAVSFQVQPGLAAENSSVLVSGGAGLVLVDTVYVLGRQVTMRFEAHGFISRTVSVDLSKGTKHLIVEMQEAPVNVVITTEPSLLQTRWSINDSYVFTADRFEQQLQPGAASIGIDNDFYRPEVLPIEVQTGKDFTHHLNLEPVTGSISVNSEPRGATVVINGQKQGITPAEIPAAPGGLHHLQVILDGYEDIEEEITLTNRLMDVRRNYRLKLRQTTVRVQALPTGGTLRVNGVETRTTKPLSLAAGKRHILQYEKPGYIPRSREVLLQLNQQADVSFQLQEETGAVIIRSTPTADVLINDKPAGVTPQTFRLQAVQQKITLVRSGYRTRELMVTPTSASPLLIEETLKSELTERLSEATPTLTTATGITMKFFDPGVQSRNRFTMGTPRNDKDRRADEFEREVKLTKPFYVSTTEITEEQFAKYKSIQASGKKHPVRNVSWLDAAGFSNWMSAQDNLQPTYRIIKGRVHSFNAAADGYRLLSEAEWEWLARVAGRLGTVRFVWGNETTIPKSSGNFADKSARGNIPQYIPRYDDGFAGVAPVGSFVADAAGLYDMAGNVSEWVHDIYDLQPPKPGQVETNPFGGQYGDRRVIKGSSFRSAAMTSLRSSFRASALQGRDDVGFRVARYLYGPVEPLAGVQP